MSDQRPLRAAVQLFSRSYPGWQNLPPDSSLREFGIMEASLAYHADTKPLVKPDWTCSVKACLPGESHACQSSHKLRSGLMGPAGRALSSTKVIWTSHDLVENRQQVTTRPAA